MISDSTNFPIQVKNKTNQHKMQKHQPSNQVGEAKEKSSFRKAKEATYIKVKQTTAAHHVKNPELLIL